MSWLHWALLAAFFAGMTAVLAKVGVKEMDPDWATAIRTTIVLIFTWSVALARPAQAAANVSPRAWLFLILSGLATGASWLCYFRALQLGQASQVAPVDKSSVVVTMLLAAVLLGEHLTLRHWLGGSLVLAGTLVLART